MAMPTSTRRPQRSRMILSDEEEGDPATTIAQVLTAESEANVLSLCSPVHNAKAPSADETAITNNDDVDFLHIPEPTMPLRSRGRRASSIYLKRLVSGNALARSHEESEQEDDIALGRKLENLPTAVNRPVSIEHKDKTKAVIIISSSDDEAASNMPISKRVTSVDSVSNDSGEVQTKTRKKKTTKKRDSFIVSDHDSESEGDVGAMVKPQPHAYQARRSVSFAQRSPRVCSPSPSPKPSQSSRGIHRAICSSESSTCSSPENMILSSANVFTPSHLYYTPSHPSEVNANENAEPHAISPSTSLPSPGFTFKKPLTSQNNPITPKSKDSVYTDATPCTPSLSSRSQIHIPNDLDAMYTPTIRADSSSKPIFQTPFNFPSSAVPSSLHKPIMPYTTPKPRSTVAAFAKQREQHTARWYAVFNQKIFDNKLPTDMEIKWSKTLNKTAGLTRLYRLGTKNVAEIELSTKVHGPACWPDLFFFHFPSYAQQHRNIHIYIHIHIYQLGFFLLC